MSEWQPIETAPEGERILVGWSRLGAGEAQWDKRSDWAVEIAAQMGGKFYGAGGLDPRILWPTHWMPLPEPPK